MVIVALLVLAAGTVSAAPRQQNAVDICSRTQEVQDAILDMTGGTCSIVPGTQLNGITNLDFTGYSSASSASIVPGDFAGLGSLDFLSITYAPMLTTVPANAFSEVSGSLTVLVLNWASITSVHEDAFTGLTHLTALDLGDNRLSSLHEDTLDGLTSLRLTNNHIKVLEDGIFEGALALQSIDMGI